MQGADCVLLKDTASDEAADGVELPTLWSLDNMLYLLSHNIINIDLQKQNKSTSGTNK